MIYGSSLYYCCMKICNKIVKVVVNEINVFKRDKEKNIETVCFIIRTKDKISYLII